MADDTTGEHDDDVMSSSSSTYSSSADSAIVDSCGGSVTAVLPVPTRDGWYWQTDKGRWHLFEQPTSKTIEEARRNDPNSTVQFTIGKHSYAIDLKKMVQVNNRTGTERAVVRVGTGFTSVESPAAHLWFWQSQKRADRWHSFNAEDSEALEKQFSTDPEGTVCLSCDDRTYSVDLKNNIQTNVKTSVQYCVKRVAPVTSLTTGGAVKKTFIWQWENDNDDWETFDASYGIVSSEAIDTAFMSDHDATISFHFNRMSYVVDLKEMTQTNQTSGKQRKIRRIRSGQEDSRGIFPTTWTNITAADLQLIPVGSTGSTAKEHRTIVDLFTTTMPGYWLKSIKRIQNRKQFQRFHLYRTQLEERLGKGKGVRRLFHGTSEKNINAICQQGFDFRLKSTYHYGQGSYFARDACYSARYTDCVTMFVAQVLVGEYTIGDSEMVRPPARNKKGELYDSVVDDTRTPSIFVVFDIAHSYPEYLIEYSNGPRPDPAPVPVPVSSPLRAPNVAAPAAPLSSAKIVKKTAAATNPSKVKSPPKATQRR